MTVICIQPTVVGALYSVGTCSSASSLLVSASDQPLLDPSPNNSVVTLTVALWLNRKHHYMSNPLIFLSYLARGQTVVLRIDSVVSEPVNSTEVKKCEIKALYVV